MAHVVVNEGMLYGLCFITVIIAVVHNVFVVVQLLQSFVVVQLLLILSLILVFVLQHHVLLESQR